MKNWLARQETLYGFTPDAKLLEPRREAPRQADYFDVMGGRAAIRESMQLELIDDPVTGIDDSRSIEIDSIDGVRVASRFESHWLAWQTAESRVAHSQAHLNGRR